MECPNHPQVEATGYCFMCGDFGCPDCLTMHEGNLLCERHYRPVARKIEEEKKQEQIRKKHPRQRLVVRYLDGRCAYGVCFALNLREPGFHLQLVEKDGTSLEKSVHVRFHDLKAVFLVKSFDGNFDKNLRYREWTPEGAELVVRFKDGEVVHGYSLRRYDPNEPRFHLTPLNQATNNISIIVEQHAVEGVFTPEEFKQKEAEEKAEEPEQVVTPVTQEETTGDFYYEGRNYLAALEQYRVAANKYPSSRRLQKKMLVCLFNVGIHHIKRHEYDKALFHMEAALKMDPRNDRIKRKVQQLQHILEKGAGKGAASMPPDED